MCVSVSVLRLFGCAFVCECVCVCVWCFYIRLFVCAFVSFQHPTWHKVVFHQTYPRCVHSKMNVMLHFAKPTSEQISKHIGDPHHCVQHISPHVQRSSTYTSAFNDNRLTPTIIDLHSMHTSFLSVSSFLSSSFLSVSFSPFHFAWQFLHR